MRSTFYCLCLGSGSGYTMQERNFIKATSEWLLHLPETDLMPFISDEITFLMLHYLSHWIQYYSPVTECCVIRWQRRNEYKGVIAPYNNLLLTATIILAVARIPWWWRDWASPRITMNSRALFRTVEATTMVVLKRKLRAICWRW